MSIIYDFKAIRQDAAALGIRAIGEDELPKLASFSELIEQPVSGNVCRPGPSILGGLAGGAGSAGGGSYTAGSCSSPARNMQEEYARAQRQAAAQQQAMARQKQAEVFQINLPEDVEVDLRSPGHITYAKPELPALVVTIEDLLRLDDKDFAKLIDRVDPGRLKHLLSPPVDDFEEDDDI